MQNTAEQSVQTELKGRTIILGVTGSIAAYKSAEIASSLVKLGADVHVIMTESACKLIGPATFRGITGNPTIVSMWDEPKVGEITHVALPERADLMLVAPATANIIGKFASGIADDMLSTAALVVRCPVIMAPAMNCNMYTNPIVIGNMDRLKSLGWQFIEAENGRLACGDIGVGRLADPSIVVSEVVATLKAAKKDLTGARMLITAGPTREPIDPVRFVSNYSSGKMGYAIAEAAACRGASVTLVSGPTDIAVPSSVRVIRVETAEEMLDAVTKEIDEIDILVAAAAVADYRPAGRSEHKIKKKNECLHIDLEKTEDILKKISENKRKKVLVGFAAETENLIENAKRKLNEKNLDLIVANDVTAPGGVFGSDSNVVTLLSQKGEQISLPRTSKQVIADKILDYITTNLWEGLV